MLNCLLHKQSLTRVFLFLQEKQVFETSNGFHAHPYTSKYHHTNFQTSIHSDAPSAAQTVNRQSKMKFFVKVHILSKDSSFDHWMIIIHQVKIKNQQTLRFKIRVFA